MPDRPGPQQHGSASAPGPAGAFTGQLVAPGYVLDARPPRPRPPRARPERQHAPAAAASRPTPCVMLLSRSCDGELDAVEHLLATVGVRSARINADELDAVDLLVDPASGTARLNGWWLRPTVTWRRHFSARAIEGSGHAAGDLFLRDSWAAAASQLGAISAHHIQSRRAGLVEQLLLAQHHHVAVPRTAVTTDPAQARDTLRGSRLVVKALDQHFVEAVPGRLTGVFPVVTGGRGLTSGPRPGPPVIVQEYVEHDAEVRAYYVDGHVLGFAVSKDTPADPWLAPDRVVAREVDLPSSVVAAARVLASALSLRYAALDFLVRAGAPVFLEANPDGDWRWIETKACTTAVTLAVTRMLCHLHREPGPGRPPAAGRSAGRLDLMAFLSAAPGQPPVSSSRIATG